MWKAIQDFEKADFIRDYQNGIYTDDDIVIVDTSAKYGGSTKEPNNLTISDFVLNEILIIVRIYDN